MVHETKRIRCIKLRRYVNPNASVMEIATKAEKVVSVPANAKASEVLSVMLNRGLRSIPVVEK